MDQFSLNNRLILEVYKTDKSLRANVSNGFATIAQKNGLKGLKVLVDANICQQGITTLVKSGQIAYIREELLHTQAWAVKSMECDTLSVPFIIVDANFVEFIGPALGPAA